MILDSESGYQVAAKDKTALSKYGLCCLPVWGWWCWQLGEDVEDAMEGSGGVVLFNVSIALQCLGVGAGMDVDSTWAISRVNGRVHKILSKPSCFEATASPNHPYMAYSIQPRNGSSIVLGQKMISQWVWETVFWITVINLFLIHQNLICPAFFSTSL